MAVQQSGRVTQNYDELHDFQQRVLHEIGGQSHVLQHRQQAKAVEHYRDASEKPCAFVEHFRETRQSHHHQDH